MLVSKKLLINTDPIFKKISDKKFIEICNKSGIEVEQVINHTQIPGLEIVKIIAINQHPNADKLHLVKIKRLNDVEQEIVCGANNLQVDKYAIFAPIGTKFNDDFIIEERLIRGVKSQGMLCGYAELIKFGSDNLHDDDKQGVILFDEAKLGDQNIAKYILNDDTIYDIAIPSNRNDLNAIACLAAELRYAYDQVFDLDFEIIFSKKVEWLPFKKVDSKLCNDVAFIEIDELPPFIPSWQQKQILMSCGYKINNNWLDLINLFSLYFANPMHIYDASELNVKKLSVAPVVNTCKFNALDGKQYQVPKNSIGIFHGDELINLAGIIGDEKHKYHANSSKVIIEIANFNASTINKTNKKLNINSKAATIFSKPLSSWITQNLVNEFTRYLENMMINYKIYRKFDLISPLNIAYDHALLYKFLGLTEPIHFNQLLTPSLFHVHPSRLDMQDQYDVFEEVLKTIDLNVLMPKPIQFTLQETDDLVFNNQNIIANYLVDWGMFEVKTYNLTQSSKDINLHKLENIISLINPISSLHSQLRTSLLAHHLDVLSFNLAHKRSIYNIFEFQKINWDSENERTILAGLISSYIECDLFAHNNIQGDYLNIKSLLQNAFSKINAQLEFSLAKKNDFDGVLYNDYLIVKHHDKKIGLIAKINKQYLKQNKIEIDHDVYTFSIDVSSILTTNSFNKVKQVSYYPIVYRDMNIETNDANTLNKIIKQIKLNPNVKSCKIIDEFIQIENKRYTLRVSIGDETKTLTTQEIDNIIESLNQEIKLFTSTNSKPIHEENKL